MVPYGVYPGVVLVEPVPSVRGPEPLPDIAPAAPSPPDPVFVQRSVQGAPHTDGDWQACNRRAMAQPDALADAGVFHRSALACMAERGYTVK